MNTIRLSTACVVTIALILTTVNTALAQVPPIPLPTLPNGGETTNNQAPNIERESQPTPSATTPGIRTPTIDITSHENGDRVPVGELTIDGTSSDNEQSNCQVYADVNDISPMQNATAAGPRGNTDFSGWTFTYTQDYQLIKEGVNELTAKISCFGNDGASTPLSKWHSVNVTGVADGGGATTTQPPITQPPTPEDSLFQ